MLTEKETKKITMTGEIKGISTNVEYETESEKAPSRIQMNFSKDNLYGNVIYEVERGNLSFVAPGLQFAKDVFEIAVEQINDILQRYATITIND